MNSSSEEFIFYYYFLKGLSHKVMNNDVLGQPLLHTIQKNSRRKESLFLRLFYMKDLQDILFLIQPKIKLKDPKN